MLLSRAILKDVNAVEFISPVVREKWVHFVSLWTIFLDCTLLTLFYLMFCKWPLFIEEKAGAQRGK